MEILIALAQACLLPVAGYALFRLWKRLNATGKWVGLLVTAGLVVRIVLGLGLFWASYLPVRFPAGVEDDNGFWFYAWDARTYFREAVSAVQDGWRGILDYRSGAAAPFYVRVLASFVFLLGGVAPVGLLMNAFAFLGTCAAMLSIFPRESRTSTLAIGALSLSPSLILWSIQPLKDVVFMLMVALFVAAAFRWQNIWRSESRPALRALGTGVLLVVLLYGIAGIRWYVAFLFVVAAVPFFALVSVRRQAWKPVVLSILVLPCLVAALYRGAGVYIPEELWRVVRPATSAAALAKLPKFVLTRIIASRAGFKRTTATTDIVGADAVRTPPPPAQTPSAQPANLAAASLVVPTVAQSAVNVPPAAAPVARNTPAPATAPVEPATTTAETLEVADEQTAATEKPIVIDPAEPEASPTSSPATSQISIADTQPSRSGSGAPSAHGTNGDASAAKPDPVSAAPTPDAKPAASVAAPPTPAAAVKPTAPHLVVATPHEPVVATNNHQVAASPAAPSPAPPVLAMENHAPHEPAPKQSPAKPASALVARHAKKKSKVSSIPTAPPPGPIVATSVAPQPVEPPPAAPDVPPPAPRPSHVKRLVAGGAAMILPRFAGEALGLFRVAGDGKMWFFVELDTLYFDLVLLFCAIALVQGLRRRGWRSPALGFLLVTTLVMGGMLAYTITNFGTLFRHRSMVFIGLVMIPLVVAAERARRDDSMLPDATPEGGS